MLVARLTSCVLLVGISSLGTSSLASAACTVPGSPLKWYQNQGSLQSTGYPSQYYGDEQCHWFLNPPRGKMPDVMILNVHLETNVDGLADAADVCYNSKNYVELGNGVRGCGKEGPLCLAYVLMSSTDLKCHRMIGKYFSHCQTLLQNVWPFKVSFVTTQPDSKAGFSMNYTFYDCDADPFPTTAPPGVNSNTASRTTTSKNTNVTSPSATKSSIMAKISPPKTKTTLSPKTIKTVATKPKTATRTRIPTTLKSVKETAEPVAKNTNLALIIVLVSLCVLFVILVVAVIFRRKLRDWATKKPPAPMNGSPTNNNNGTRYTDAYIIPIDKKPTYIIQPSPITSKASSIPSAPQQSVLDNGSDAIGAKNTSNDNDQNDDNQTNSVYTVSNEASRDENHIYSSIPT